MDVLTLYVGQGALAALRSGSEAIIVDAYVPDNEDVAAAQVTETLSVYLRGKQVRGLVLTGFDSDHANERGVDAVLGYEPDWVMYPKYYKDTDTATEVFRVIDRHVARRKNTARPLTRHSVRLDKVDSRFLAGLADEIDFELFSPHIEDMDNSNNSSIVLKVSGHDSAGFDYLVTGDTETERWDTINRLFGASLRADVLAAPHHGARSGANAQTILLISANTVLISAGVNNQYGHPHPQAVKAYKRVAEHVHATNDEDPGVCLLTKRTSDEWTTERFPHAETDN